MSDYNIVIQ